MGFFVEARPEADPPMLLILKPGVSEAEASDVSARLRMAGLAVHRTEHDGQVRLAAIGDPTAVDWEQVRGWPAVGSATRIPVPFKLVSRAFHPQDTVITVGRCAIGSRQLALMAGPCSVEGEEQVFRIAAAVSRAGATVMRGGAYKPRTSPYSFQGLGEEGLKLLRRAADAHGLAVVSEVMDTSQVGLLARYADILQIGARNMQNYSLLREVGHADRPVLLKRGLAATIEEWLMSAEHVMSQGNGRVILCERGIRTFETYTRNTLDLNAIPVVKELSHLPVIVDPSHGTGIRNKVAPMARAAIAAGADGLIVEVHHDPDRALSDGAQSLWPDQFDALVEQIRTIAAVLGRDV
jgi:3-deoxy-7-phosphoheptulonate synthase